MELRIAASLCLFVATVTALRGGTLQVCVKDPSGAVVPSSSVAAYSRATQQRTVVPTDPAGCARFQGLPKADYEFSIEANGFATEQVETSYDGIADQTVGVQMRLGHASQTTVVTASRTDEGVDLVPASVSSLDQEDFASRQSPALSDVLRQLPNVEMSGGPRPTGQIPSLRAYAGPEIITLINGARVNFSNGLFSPLFVQPFLIGEVEVIRGTSSTTYGTGGMGGVLALRTLRARDEVQSGRVWGGQVSGGYHSGDASQSYNAMFYGAVENFDFLASFGYRDFHAIRQGGGTELRPASGHSFPALLDIGWRPGVKWRLRLSNEYYQEQSFRPNNPQADATFPFLQNNHIQQNAGTLHASRDQTQNDQALQFSLYRASNKFWNEAISTPSAAATNTALVTWGGSVQNTTQLRSNAVGNHRITYGLDSYDDYQFAVSAGTPNPVVPNGHQTDYGLFALDRMVFGERWTLTPGFRWDHFTTNVDVNNGKQPSTSLNRVSPRIALSFSPSAAVMIYADFGQSFRAPVLSELYQSLTLNTGFANFVPNPGLQDERSNQFEMGAVLRKRGLFNKNDSFRFRAAGFYSADRNLIQTVIVGTFQNPFLGQRPIQQAQNVSRAERWGGEFEVEYSSGGWFAKLAGSHIIAIDRKTAAGLYSPPDKLVATVYYQFRSPNLSIHWTTTGVDAQDYDSVLVRRTGGYGVHDAFASWYPASWRLRFDFGIANLLDKRYVVYKQATGYPNVPDIGRNARITATFWF